MLVVRHAQGVHPGVHRRAVSSTRGRRSSSPQLPWSATCISIFLKGRGGKGVATGAGVVLALVPLVFLIILVVWVPLDPHDALREPRVAGRLVPRAGAGHRLRPTRCRTRSPRCSSSIIIFWAHRGNIGRLRPRHREPRQAAVVGRPLGARRRSGALSMRVTVVGSGSWGSAFSRLLVRGGHDVQVLTLTGDEAAQLNATHENPHFLPGRRAAAGDRASSPWRTPTSRAADLIVYAVPTQAVRKVAHVGGAAARRRVAAALAGQGLRARHAQASDRGRRGGDRRWPRPRSRAPTTPKR